MVKIDFKKDLKELYNPAAKDITLVDVPKMNFIVIDGQGAPASKQFQQSIEALYPIAYAIKFDKKKTIGIDYGVMPLEGLWWAEDMIVFSPEKTDRNKWLWTLMIMQPDIITEIDFEKAKETSIKKKPDIFILNTVRFGSFTEGKSSQIMHIGAFSEESSNIRRIHNKIAEIGGRLSGKHHEIYLSDFRKVEPSKMKTILRQPYVL
jgi:hypothetical protein